MLRLLSIAGSDPSGGAGLQMDIRVFSTLKAEPLGIPTAITVQNSKCFIDFYALDPKFVKDQIEMVFDENPIDGVKIGMIANENIAETVYNSLSQKKTKIVFDPVLKATLGKPLYNGSLDAIKKIISISHVVTPNRKELQTITGESDIEKACRLINANVIVTSADSGEHVVNDLIFDGKDITIKKHEKIKTQTHGSGCVFSSALLYFICCGYSLLDSYERAKKVVKLAISYGMDLHRTDTGKLTKLFPEVITEREAERIKVINRLKKAFNKLKDLPGIYKLVPEVQINLVEAIKYPQNAEDVAGFPGRIIRKGDEITKVSDPEFGASSHMARALLVANRYNKSILSVMNIRYDRRLIEKLKDHFQISHFSRKEEPETVKEKEGKSLDWGVEQAIKRCKSVPDIIFDEGDIGKEPMIRVFGTDSLDVVRKIEKILRIYNG